MIGLGCMRLSTDPARDDTRSAAVFAAALAAGIPLLDTADAYARDATDSGSQPARSICTCSVRALAKLVADGVVREIGLSNVTLTQLREARAIAPIAAVEVELSPWRTEALRGGLVAACADAGIRVARATSTSPPRRGRRRRERGNPMLRYARGMTAARTDRLAPRRRPRQARSAATVDALLEASRRVLIERGYAGFTTERVAAVAGASIGTLYEYFPTKDALLSAIVDEFLAAIGRAVASALVAQPLPAADAAVTREDIARVVRGLLSALLAVKLENLELNTILSEQLPRVQGAGRLEQFNRQLEPMLAGFIGQLRLPGARDPARTAFVLVHAIQGVLTEALRTRRVRDEHLVDELTALAVGLLAPIALAV